MAMHRARGMAVAGQDGSDVQKGLDQWDAARLSEAMSHTHAIRQGDHIVATDGVSRNSLNGGTMSDAGGQGNYLDGGSSQHGASTNVLEGSSDSAVQGGSNDPHQRGSHAVMQQRIMKTMCAYVEVLTRPQVLNVGNLSSVFADSLKQTLAKDGGLALPGQWLVGMYYLCGHSDERVRGWAREQVAGMGVVQDISM